MKLAVLDPISDVTKEFFPAEGLDIIEVPSFQDAGAQAEAFIAAVDAARHMTCLVVPPGTYPSIHVRKNILIRAQVADSVEIVGEKNFPALVASASCVRLEGVFLRAAQEDGAQAALLTSGQLILEDCSIIGSVVTSENSKVKLYLRKCRIQSAGAGLHIASASEALVESSAFLKCGVGIMAGEGSRLEVRHTRFEDCGQTSPIFSGSAILATKASIFCSGCRFIHNEKGVELMECLDAQFFACVFDANLLGGFIATGGAPPKLHTVQFLSETPADAKHLILTDVEAEMQFCYFADGSSGGGKAREESPQLSLAGRPDHPQFQDFGGMEETRKGLEAIFQNARTALQKREQGLPIPLQSFHCVFEGKPFLGQYKAGIILANNLHKLGFLSTNKIVNIPMDDLLLHKRSLEEVVAEVQGGILMLYVSPLARTREAHAFYSSMREIVSQLLRMCGDHSVLILCGERDFVRPILRHSPETEALGIQTVRFSVYSPAESARMFAELCSAHEIKLTPRAIEKILLTFYMLDDRKDKRFSTSEGVANLFKVSEQQHRQRCELERNYRLAMDEADLKIPLEKNVEPLMSSQPAFVDICPQCHSEFPWLPQIHHATVHCPSCDCEWKLDWGIWRDSSFLQRITKERNNAAPGSLSDTRYRFGQRHESR